jgi:LPS export ABC transporter protein LptC
MLFLSLSCKKEKNNNIPSFPDRANVPILRTTDVTTMISDSGITRYRISAPEWLIYDKAEEPFWDFPKGIVFERFDGEYKTDANIKSNKAVFYDKLQIWELTGNVKATNLNGELFESEKLFWNQEKGTIYSDQFISITQKDKVITGMGFESNQTFSNYTITKVQGIFPINDVE